MDADYHVHSSYSDGSHLPWMVAAAAEAGLDGIGIADHANVSDRPAAERATRRYAFTLDLTYERRRQAIESLAEEYDIEIFDAVEMDYHQADEAQIAAFLEDADFEYAIGSVHEIRGTNVHFPGPFEDLDHEGRREVLGEYVDRLVALIESELFDVAAHVDIIERNPVFRGRIGESEYRRIAGALADSRTVPEINAGRIDQEYGRFHPRSDFLDVLREYDVDLTVGTDAHSPDALGNRVPSLRGLIEDRGIDPVSPLS